MNFKKVGIRAFFLLLWAVLFFGTMRYIGAQWEFEGRVSSGLIVGISFVSQQQILYSIATVFASGLFATSVVLFLVKLFRSNRRRRDKVLMWASVGCIALFAVGFFWNQRNIQLAKLPTAYRYYDSTGRLLEPEKFGNGTRRDVNIILISIDTLNPLHLGIYGYDRNTSPVLDSLATEGVLFQNAISHSPKTSPSHMSLFTSLYPSVHKIRNWNNLQGGYSLDHHIITLPEILNNAGYTTAAFTGGGNVQSSIGFGDGFEVYHNDDQIWENAIQWLDENHDTKFFLFLHTFKVHSPYLPPPPYNNMFGSDYNGKIRDSESELLEYFKANYDEDDAFPGTHSLFWELIDKNDPKDVERVIALYDGGIRFMDEQLMGVLLNRLRQYDLVDNTLLIFTSDHGEEFLQHGDFLHKELYDEHIRIPLIMHIPGDKYKKQIVEQQVSLIDLTPTILDYLSLPIPVMLQGTSLWQIMDGKDLNLPVFSERIVISDVPDKKKSIRTNDWKYIWWPTKQKAELFNLASDPMEQTNVVAEHPESKSELHRMVTEWMSENQKKGASIRTFTNTLDAETIDKLKSLGYIR